MCGEICQGGTEDPFPPSKLSTREREGGEQTSEEEEKIPGTAPRSSSQGEEEGEEESLSNH